MSRPDRPAPRAAQPELTPLEGRRLLTTLPVVRSLTPSTFMSASNLRITTVAAPRFIQTAATARTAAGAASNLILVNSPSASAGSPLVQSRVQAEAAGVRVSFRTSPTTITQPVNVLNFVTGPAPTATGTARLVTQPLILNDAGTAGGIREKFVTAREV